MAPFRRRGDELESRLRERRHEPPVEFVDGIVSRVSATPKRRKLQPVLGMAVVAAGVVLFGAFGGLSYASSATESVARVIAMKPSSPSSPGGSVAGGTLSTYQSSSASTAQYEGMTTICHKLGNGRFNLHSVNNNAIPAHEGHGDTLPGPGGTCPGPPIS